MHRRRTSHRLEPKAYSSGSASGYGQRGGRTCRGRSFLHEWSVRKRTRRARTPRRQKIQQQLDEALAESSPASDPVSIVTSGEEEDWGTEPSAPAPPSAQALRRRQLQRGAGLVHGGEQDRAAARPGARSRAPYGCAPGQVRGRRPTRRACSSSVPSLRTLCAHTTGAPKLYFGPSSASCSAGRSCSSTFTWPSLRAL